MLRPARPRPAYTASLVLAALALAGCGDASDEAAVAPSSTTPAATTPTSGVAAAPLDSANAQPEKADKDDESQIGNREGDPELPAAKGDELGDPPAGGGKIAVESGRGEPTWRVSARTEGEQFCVDAATIGATDPPSMCSDVTVAALNLMADGGGVQASVNGVLRTAAGTSEDVLVWGFVERSVDRVVVEYGGASVEATVSKSSEELDLGERTEVFGEGVQKLPKRLRVKTFGISVPVATGNPPTTAKAESKKPAGDTATLTLQ